MAIIRLNGRITETGQLEVDLPDNLPAGEVSVTIEVDSESEIPWEKRPWTDEEIQTFLRVEPKSGAEIVAQLQRDGGWEDQDIHDGAEWVNEQRRKNHRNPLEW